MAIELTPAQQELALTLSKHAEEACTLVGLRCEKVEPRNFYLTIYRYYGKVQGMTSEMDRCIDWCLSKGKLVFTAQRFGNWCAKKVEFHKREERKMQEMNAQKSPL